MTCSITSLTYLVKSRLTERLYASKLVNTRQPALCKHQSTEIIHGYLVNANGSHKISRLCVLDLSAAFDTVDCNISNLSSIVLV